MIRSCIYLVEERCTDDGTPTNIDNPYVSLRVSHQIHFALVYKYRPYSGVEVMGVSGHQKVAFLIDQSSAVGRGCVKTPMPESSGNRVQILRVRP